MSKQRVNLDGSEYRLDRLKTLYLYNYYNMSTVSDTITWEELEKILTYDLNTGNFYWNETRGPALKGSIAGSLENTGYIAIRIGLKSYLAHRLAWLYCFREWPENNIDHVDRDRSNNSLDNLRDVTQFINGRNRGLNKNNTSGYKGVYRDKNKIKWNAEIIINGIKHRLGSFNTPEEASIAYVNFEENNT